uniref:T-complex protein 1 subunit gamma n=2 Tax=Lygus hesperus TaxID=30085 RepID=A0A0A9W1M3_LYGHE
MNGATGIPMLVLNTTTQQEHGRKAQLGNVAAAYTVADILRTTLGPRAMFKMILDPMGGIVLTNDGNTILREIDVSHPAAKNMIELSRTQDEEVGDGTTSIIIFAAELLKMSEPFLLRNMHPRVIITSYYQAFEDGMKFLTQNMKKIENDDDIKVSVRATLGTKCLPEYIELITDIAIQAVNTVKIVNDFNTMDVDTKRYARVERILGGSIGDSYVLDGILLNKDVVDSKMRRRIENPRILLLDCSLEYKKAESVTSIEVLKEGDWDAILKQEEEYIENICKEIARVKPDLVITEKGISELAAHYLYKSGISCIRRVKKTDNNRIARATGASIVNDPRYLRDSDIGTKCGLFTIEKIGDEYYTYLMKCQDPKACSIVLRGGSKDLLQELERNLMDAISVARCLTMYPNVLPGGGATEMALSAYLLKQSKKIDGVGQLPYKSVSKALEIIPRILAKNAGANAVQIITELRAKHTLDEDTMKDTGFTWGIDGNEGVIVDVCSIDLWEPYIVKTQIFKTAIEASALLLRVDAIVSGIRTNQNAVGSAEAYDDE